MKDNHDGMSDTPSPERPGTFGSIVPDHQLISIMGRGNYAEVWLAKSALGTYRAIKITYESAFQHERPFEREFNGVLKFEPTSRMHEGLVDVLHVGRNNDAGYFYCVMELADDAVSGGMIDPANYTPRTLSQSIAEHKQLPFRDCLQLGITLASALEFLHRRGLVHRDVKPSNIIFVNGIPKLADVGLVADMADAKSYVGTEGYIPPEGPGTARADIFSLGKVLYEASTGKDRHDYPELPAEVDDSLLNELRGLNRIILKACHPNPAQRYHSAGELEADLLSLQRGDTRIRSSNRFSRTKPVVSGAVLVTAIVALWFAGHRDSKSPMQLSSADALSTPATVPSITGFEPASGAAGTVVTVSGKNFSSDVSSNIVYFGAVRGSVLTATLEELTVRVPACASYARITITVGGLTAAANQIFQPAFSGKNVTIDTNTFATRVDLATGNGPLFVAIGDLDNDGKPDLIANNAYSHTSSLFRNKSSSGVITEASFELPVEIPIGEGTDNPYGLAIADVDGDGKLDLIMCDRVANQISILRNQTSPGPFTSDSFAPRVNFPTDIDPRHVVIADLNHDGKLDIVSANYATNSISVLQNNGSVGHISFAPAVNLTTAPEPYDIAIGDFDGDNKTDLAARTGDGISFYLNRSSGGAIRTGSFSKRVDVKDSTQGAGIVAGDLDGDGALDLVTTSYLSKTMSIHRKKKPGELTAGSYDYASFPIEFRGHSPALGDLNGDGKTDICLVGEEGTSLSTLYVYQNNSAPGSFTPASIASPVTYATGWNAWGVVINDLDGDGRPDIVFCNAYVATISIYRNALP